MYWSEDGDKAPVAVPDDIVDLAFAIDCRRLPVDHAHALSQALLQALPWLHAEEQAGIHLIHVAESGHGWQRPPGGKRQLLHLSRRTRLVLRLPQARVRDAQQLTGMTLTIDGFAMAIGAARVRLLSPLTTLFARYVVAREQEDEAEFVQQAAGELARMGIVVRKLLCGKSHRFRLPEETVFTRRLMVADLSVEDSVKLQQRGLGPGRKLGWGLFLPHKGIAPSETPTR
jgi:CRISPR-associated protein Cas6